MEKLIKQRKIVKQKLRSRKRVFGGWVSLSHPSITEIFTRADFDFIGIDLEHSTISQSEAQRIIAACQAQNVLCFPRISSHNAEMTRRLLDSGADGIIIPNVATAGQVEAIVNWCKYPPLGKRGFGISRAQGYGFDFDRYVKQWNQTSTTIIQIESIEAVRNIDELLSNDEIDAAMVGPYDISGSLGIPGQLTHPKVIAAGKEIIAACKRHHKACGTQIIAPTQELIKNAFTQGFTFVILSSDVFLLWKWAAQMKDFVRQFRRTR